jgi:hypothetical protein
MTRAGTAGQTLRSKSNTGAAFAHPTVCCHTLSLNLPEPAHYSITCQSILKPTIQIPAKDD